MNSRNTLLYFIIILSLHTTHTEIKAQSKLEAGPLIGTSWYNGDLNPHKQFYNIHPAIGGIFRYCLNDRLAFRGGLTWMGISGEYPHKDIYIPEMNNSPYTFKRNLTDLTTLLEINFFSFDHPSNKESIFTPYATLGLGSTFYKRYVEENDNLSEKPTFVLSLPFGAGVKWKANSWMNLNLEWIIRKSFADDLDQVGFNNSVYGNNPHGYSTTSLSHNNDWYSAVAISATFTVFSARKKCNDGF